MTNATSMPSNYTVSPAGQPAVNLAMRLPDTLEGGGAPGRFLDNFGRGNRDDEPRVRDSSIVQSLAMMNDNTMIIPRIRRTNPSTTVAKALAASSDPAVITETLYIATLSRYPTDTEKAQAAAYLKSGTQPNSAKIWSHRVRSTPWSLCGGLKNAGAASKSNQLYGPVVYRAASRSVPVASRRTMNAV